MKCGFCGHEFSEEEGIQACGKCGIGGCKKIHCPKCNYGNPLEPQIVKRIKKLFDKQDQGD